MCGIAGGLGFSEYNLKNVLSSIKHRGPDSDGVFVDNDLFAQDSLALRNEMREAAPDVLTKFNFECESCGHTETVDMPIDTGFFWPSSES